MTFLLRTFPRYEALQKQAELYPEFEPASALVCLSLMRVGSDLVAIAEQYLKTFEISQGKYLVLILLYQEPDKRLSPSQIAERSDVTRTNITGLLDGLEQSELVERKPNPEDRRSLDIFLTPKGEALLHRIFPGFYEMVAEMMGGLSEEERQLLVHLLAKVNTSRTETGRS